MAEAQQAISAHTRCIGDFGFAFLRSLKHKRSSNPFPEPPPDKSLRTSKGFPSGFASNLLLHGLPSGGRPGFIGSARVSCNSCHACSRAGMSSGDSRAASQRWDLKRAPMGEKDNGAALAEDESDGAGDVVCGDSAVTDGVGGSFSVRPVALAASRRSITDLSDARRSALVISSSVLASVAAISSLKLFVRAALRTAAARRASSDFPGDDGSSVVPAFVCQ